MKLTYHTATIRRLLLLAFNDEEFNFFCYDRFPAVHQQFATGMSFPAKVQALIDHCVRHNDFAQLLPLVEEANPTKYAEFVPSLQKPEPKALTSIPQSPISNFQSLPRQPFEPEMILIPAGEFLMGSDPRQDKDAFDDEQPQHLLCLPDYYMAKIPVTNAQYLAFVQVIGDQPPKHWPKGKPPGYKADHPVVNVSWYDAVAYCDWLVQVTGKPYRLPSEAEWEKGARGTDGRIYPWGNQWEARRCNSRELLPGDTTPVDAHLDGASPYGLLDMVGNAEEWTRSLWGKDLERPDFKYPYQPGSDRENARAGDEICRVLRGASVFYDERGYIIAHARCAFRRRFNPNHERDDWGFRVAMSLF